MFRSSEKPDIGRPRRAQVIRVAISRIIAVPFGTAERISRRIGIVIWNLTKIVEPWRSCSGQTCAHVSLGSLFSVHWERRRRQLLGVNWTRAHLVSQRRASTIGLERLDQARLVILRLVHAGRHRIGLQSRWRKWLQQRQRDFQST